MTLKFGGESIAENSCLSDFIAANVVKNDDWKFIRRADRIKFQIRNSNFFTFRKSFVPQTSRNLNESDWSIEINGWFSLLEISTHRKEKTKTKSNSIDSSLKNRFLQRNILLFIEPNLRSILRFVFPPIRIRRVSINKDKWQIMFFYVDPLLENLPS